ncbi:membrane protein insertion efficiency factor YidD [Streptomyces levis]|uniref:membrane protein insertion efficiency factor YidD n=1 Tax=Streptomyces levis TaxID=285566 RepID=UPI003C7B966B
MSLWQLSRRRCERAGQARGRRIRRRHLDTTSRRKWPPTCSTYAVRALHRHGALRGGRLILVRLLRCRPAAARRRGFHDPVPPPSRAGAVRGGSGAGA